MKSGFNEAKKAWRQRGRMYQSGVIGGLGIGFGIGVLVATFVAWKHGATLVLPLAASVCMMTLVTVSNYLLIPKPPKKTNCKSSDKTR
jgi:hypothetical protein